LIERAGIGGAYLLLPKILLPMRHADPLDARAPFG
jgi:hypothetical protein